MKRAGLILTAILALAPVSLSAQMLEGVSPLEDQVMMEKYRQKLQAVRSMQGRPTVALVFSGGGAKGLAQIGVIRYLEEKGIPVDLVVGNSMGALMGGAYAVGWDSHQLEHLAKTLDWGATMSDNTPREFVSYKESRYKERYIFSVPFLYSRDQFLRKIETDKRYDPRTRDDGGDFPFGAKEGEDATSLIGQNIKGSLPSGFMFGQNVNNVISSITVGYQDSLEFCNLPIPYACLATDLVSEKPKYWFCGKLTQAMRSSMSIPGMFTPIRENGMMLVDGAMRDNYPTDIAKEMGADIIIGVDVSAPPLTYSQMNNLMDIISQGIDMLGREVYLRNEKIPDVNIKPNLDGFGMMSFSPESADSLIARGYRACVEKDSLFDAVKSRLGNTSQTALSSPHAYDILENDVLVDRVELTGLTSGEVGFLRNRLNLVPGTRMTKDQIESAVTRIYAMKSFDFVNYEFSGTQEPFTLKINCHKGPIHRVGLGVRFDSEEIASVLVNVGLNAYSIQGSSVDLEGKIGSNPHVNLTYSYIPQKGPTLNARLHYKYVDRNRFAIGDAHFKPTYHNLRSEAFLSDMKMRQVGFRVGARSDYYSISSMLSDTDLSDYNSSNLQNNYFSVFATANLDTFDDGLFPSSGYQVGLDYQWTFADTKNTGERFQVLQGNLAAAFSVAPFLVLQPHLDFRTALSGVLPAPYINILGGQMRGRYLDQQIPFRGVNNVIAMGAFLSTAGIDIRGRISKNHYVTAFFDGGAMATKIQDVLSDDDSRWFSGLGLEYAYNSIMGPFRFNVHWSSLTHTLGGYISLGFDF